MSFLMIQNPGVAPIESFIVLGASTSRGNNDMIGQFGTGSKMGILSCLRENMLPYVFLGKLCLGFRTEQESINDTPYHRVLIDVSGHDGQKTRKYTEKTSMSLEFGALDWTMEMGLREFISNAIDHTVSTTGGYLSAIATKDLQVCIVEDNQVRAKDGYTRIFVPLTPSVQVYFNELGKHFLHFSSPEKIALRLLPKQSEGPAMIYRKGVYVRTITYPFLPSLFDYNFGSELSIDDARKINDHQAAAVAAQTIRNASSENIARVLTAIADKANVWEGQFNAYYLSTSSIPNEESRIKARENWRNAAKIAGKGRVWVQKGDQIAVNVCGRKGFQTAEIPESFITAMDDVGEITTSSKVLSDSDKKGIDFKDPAESLVGVFNQVWSIIEGHGLANGRCKPNLKMFTAIMEAESTVLGLYVAAQETVAINESLVSDSPSIELITTLIEEIAHHVTKSTDNSRDFQDYAFKVAAIMMAKAFHM